MTLALEYTNGNHRDASRMLGISRQTLRTKLKELRMDDGTEPDETAPA